MNSSSTTATVDMLTPEAAPRDATCPSVASKKADDIRATSAQKPSCTEVLALSMEQSAGGF